MIKTSTQVKALIRNMAKSDSDKAQLLIRNYGMERFLERVSLSRYKDNFILKGGMLVSSMVGLEHRATMDIDTTIRNMPLGVPEAEAIVEEIAAVPVEDNMRFEIKEIQRKLGITVVYVTHDQTEAMTMSDRIFLINRGEIQQCGTPQEIYNSPVNQFVADFLGKVDFFKGEVKDGRIVFPAMGGQSIPYAGPRTGKVDVAIRPENLFFTESGILHGVLETQYYLGDVDDCRVRVGDTLVRVITNGYDHKTLRDGQTVSLGLRDFMVFEDDGLLEQMLEINT